MSFGRGGREGGGFRVEDFFGSFHWEKVKEVVTLLR